MDDQELQTLLDEKELAAQLGVTQQTVSYRLKAMGKIRNGKTWVPHFLTQENKNSRLDICLNLHNKQHRIKSFLWKIVTGDEKWIYFDNPKRKHHWIYPGQTITADRYRKKLLQLNEEIERKRPFTGKGKSPV